MNNDRLPLVVLTDLWTKINYVGHYQIRVVGSELEFKFDEPNLTNVIEILQSNNILANKGETFFSLNKKNDASQIIFFSDLKNMFNSLNMNRNLINEYDFFVFDYESYYLHYDYQTKKTTSNSPFNFTSSLLKHYLSYSSLLKIFKNNTPNLIELDRSNGLDNELIILSKGTENFITNIKYKEVDDSIFGSEYVRVPVEEFQLKLINEEWISSFKSVLCNYMELQSDPQKTFGTLYKNLTYLLNQTNKNYNLFVSNFSFEKIRKQFKTEKNSYFESLNNAQDKISGQIISVPISLGASIYSFYQLSASHKTIVLICMAVMIYSMFIITVIGGYLRDINKLAKDVNEERENLKTHFPALFKDFKSDFDYMKTKRKYIRFLGWSIICSLLITLSAITYYTYSFTSVQPVPKLKWLVNQ